jgi:hypothetical protein
MNATWHWRSRDKIGLLLLALLLLASPLLASLVGQMKRCSSEAMLPLVLKNRIKLSGNCASPRV